jgi:two-component system, OmpR family, sensor kinase
VNVLKQTDASRRELVANVSHDLRTPLATLHGYLETLLIKEGRLTAAEQRSFLDIAVRQSERLRRRVEELFELAKLDANYDQVDRELFSLAELVQDVSQKFALLVDGKGIALHTQLQKDVPFIQADIALIERALENLLQNALRFTPEHGSITIALTYDGTAVTVRVQDTGCGIPSEHLPHIFDRFYRADQERRGDGAGLGLAITKRIVELHGGSIEATSTPNIGTSISFRLPIR